MKFTADTLFQIYMDGSLTDEAQVEFDKLMRKDPEFCRRVTQAVAERVGPIPDELLDKSMAKLDAQIDALWQKNRPSPFRRTLEGAAKLVLLAFAGTALVIGTQKGITKFHSVASDAGNPLGQTKSLSSLDKNNALSHKTSGGKMGTLVLKNSVALNKNSEDSSAGFGGSGKVSKKVVPSNVIPHAQGSGTGQNTVKEGALPAVNPSSGKKDDGKPVPGDSGAMWTQEGDAIRVQIETDKAQKVVVTVLDSNGKQIRALYQGPWTAGVHWLEWDGKDALGASVAPGDYTVILNADGKLMSGVVAIQPAR